MYVREPRSLLGHRSRHRFNAVADRNHRRAAGRVQKSSSVVRVDEASLAPHRARIFFQEVARENRFVGHGCRLAARPLRHAQRPIAGARAESRAILAEIARGIANAVRRHERNGNPRSLPLDLLRIDRRLGELQLHALQRFHDYVRYRQIPEPFFIRRNHEPRRVFRAAFRQRVFIRFGVVVPDSAVPRSLTPKASSTSAGRRSGPKTASSARLC